MGILSINTEYARWVGVSFPKYSRSLSNNFQVHKHTHRERWRYSINGNEESGGRKWYYEDHFLRRACGVFYYNYANAYATKSSQKYRNLMNVCSFLLFFHARSIKSLLKQIELFDLATFLALLGNIVISAFFSCRNAIYYPYYGNCIMMQVSFITFARAPFQTPTEMIFWCNSRAYFHLFGEKNPNSVGEFCIVSEDFA